MSEKRTLKETRPNRALCWPPKQPRPGGPNFIGVVALARRKWWIYLRRCETDDGREYIKVELQEKE